MGVRPRTPLIGDAKVKTPAFTGIPVKIGGLHHAVAVGFEPTVGVNPHNISSVAPSAARTRHRGEPYRSGSARPNRHSTAVFSRGPRIASRPRHPCRRARTLGRASDPRHHRRTRRGQDDARRGARPSVSAQTDSAWRTYRWTASTSPTSPSPSTGRSARRARSRRSTATATSRCCGGSRPSRPRRLRTRLRAHPRAADRRRHHDPPTTPRRHRGQLPAGRVLDCGARSARRGVVRRPRRRRTPGAARAAPRRVRQVEPTRWHGSTRRRAQRPPDHRPENSADLVVSGS